MYLAIDYGKKRIGLAIGSQFPRGIGTISNNGSFADICKKIKSICEDYQVEKIIIGLPKSPSGGSNELADEIQNLAEKIETVTGLKVIFEEESYTSVEAQRELVKRGVDVRRNKEKIDELSAILILEQYLDSI